MNIMNIEKPKGFRKYIINALSRINITNIITTKFQTSDKSTYMDHKKTSHIMIIDKYNFKVMLTNHNCDAA